MRNSKPGLAESQLHALLEFECRVRGAQHLSFPPVVAAGNRANTLHYINNTQLIKYVLLSFVSEMLFPCYATLNCLEKQLLNMVKKSMTF